MPDYTFNPTQPFLRRKGRVCVDRPSRSVPLCSIRRESLTVSLLVLIGGSGSPVLASGCHSLT